MNKIQSAIEMDRASTAIYQAFLKVPYRLSVVVGFLVGGNVFLIPQHLPGRGPSFDLNTFLSLLLSGACGYLSVYAGFAATRLSRLMMVRERVWQWGKFRFDSWEELQEFVDNQTPLEMEAVAREYLYESN